MPNFFEMAELNFLSGDYKQASKAFETFLKTAPKSKDHDQALFHLGLSRALANDSSRDLRQAFIAFRRLIAEFPHSPYRGQAEFIIGLQGQIEKLRADVKERDEKIKKLGDELQTLKQIDLQRRPSTKPKE
jgi:outer membrane protein assembly factor BamD (BamD/ComL family)